MKMKGFSLVEALLALGVVGLIGMAVMKTSEQGNKAAKQSQSKLEISQAQAELISILSNRVACTNSMGGTGADLAQLITGTTKSIPVIKSQNNSDLIGPFPQQRSGIQITSITVSKWNDIEKMANATVNYSYRLSPTTVIERNFQFSLSFEMNPTTPTTMNSCVARAAQTSLDPREICKMVVGEDALGNTYWDGTQCEFARASCEKIGRTWNTENSVCDISFEERLKIKEIECETRKGVFLKGVPVSHTTASGALTYSKCIPDDLKTGKNCYCKTEFRRHYSLASDGTSSCPGGGNTCKQITLQAGKFNIASKIFTIPNLIPDRPTFDARPVRIDMHTGLSNLHSSAHHYFVALGCFSPLAGRPIPTSWLPSAASSDYQSVYSNADGPGFDPILSFSVGANSFQGIRKHQIYGEGLIMPIAQAIREQNIGIGHTRLLTPGDRCALLVYTTISHNVLLGGLGVTMIQYTDESQFSFDPQK